VYSRYLGLASRLSQLIRMKLVHEKPDRAVVHAVDRLARLHEPVQGLQHEPVAAERDDDVGVFGRRVAVAGGEPFERVTRLLDRAGDEGYPLEALGRGAHRGPRRGTLGAPDIEAHSDAGGARDRQGREHGARGLRLYDLSLDCRGGAGRARTRRAASVRVRRRPPRHDLALLWA